MIVTLTPNPSIDATLGLSEPLEVGAVARASFVDRVAGGKGINVTHAVHLAGVKTVALFPAHPSDSFISLIEAAQLPYKAVEIAGHVRTNTTITEPTGRTTKINEPGPAVDAEVQAELIAQLTTAAQEADWVVLAGSLPQGTAPGWYAEVVRALRQAVPGVRIAVDTSDAPMRALGQELAGSAPNLIKPNGFELGQLVGVDGAELERAALDGNFAPVVEAASSVVARGIDEVLVTLGGAGAVLVSAAGAWVASPPPVQLKSTVGAGDSALAGYILARTQGADAAAALQQSVAYGTAAAGLPGTTLPAPDAVNIADTTARALHQDGN